MSVTVTLTAVPKRLQFSGPFGCASTEAVTISPTLASGTLRLLDPAGVTVADCSVSSGAGSMALTGAALLALAAAWPANADMPLNAELADGDGNLLGTGVALVRPQRGAGGESPVPQGGPLTLEAGEDIETGDAVRIVEGLARLCPAGNASGFVGLAQAAALTGEDVTVCRWGALTVSGWGLTPGALYWLPQTGGTLTSDLTGVSVARLVGIATDAATLTLAGGGLTIQTGATGIGSYVTWDPDARRLSGLAAATVGGVSSAGKLAALDETGVWPMSMIPAAATAAAVAAVRALFADLETLTNPSGEELTAVVNQLVTRLKG